jgi:hypothetical protein
VCEHHYHCHNQGASLPLPSSLPVSITTIAIISEHHYHCHHHWQAASLVPFKLASSLVTNGRQHHYHCHHQAASRPPAIIMRPVPSANDPRPQRPGRYKRTGPYGASCRVARDLGLHQPWVGRGAIRQAPPHAMNMRLSPRAAART